LMVWVRWMLEYAIRVLEVRWRGCWNWRTVSLW
jgi:hypothetical protein